MGGKIDNKENKILELQSRNTRVEDIAKLLEFPSVQALKSFMNRQGFKSVKGVFIKKDTTNNNLNENRDKEEYNSKLNESNNKTTNEKETISFNQNIETILDLQLYNVPLLKISKMINMKDYEIDKMMDEHGYIRVGEKFVIKPKPTKIKQEKKKKNISRKKEKTKKQLLEEEYKKNPAKRGTFDPINQIWVINVQLVEILDLQLKKVPINEIAKKMKMSKPGLIDFMDEKGYILENNKFIQRKLAKKRLCNTNPCVDESEVNKINNRLESTDRIYNDRVENIEFTEESFIDIQKDIQNMFNWYKNIKDHHIFGSLNKRDMEK